MPKTSMFRDAPRPVAASGGASGHERESGLCIIFMLNGQNGSCKRPTLVLDIPSTMPDQSPALARMMAEQSQQAGITVRVIDHGARAAYSQMVREKRINDACAFDSSPRSTFRVLREKLHSGLRGPWWEGYQSPQVDALIEKAPATVADAARQQIYREIYTALLHPPPLTRVQRPKLVVHADLLCCGIPAF